MDDCILTDWRIGSAGYGKRGSNRLAHRAAWEAANGPIPEGLEVLHSCDNPPCVNPAHLRVGTHRENILDAKAKGRLYTTETCPRGHIKDKVDARGWRYCSLCHREQTREHARRKRARGKAAV